MRFASSIVVSVAVFAGCSPATTEAPPKATPPAQVHLVRAKRGDTTRSIVLPANVLPYQQATLYAKVGGYVKTISVDKGDAVKEGALLADIEVPELIADRANYQAELEVAAVDYKRVSEAQAKAPDLVIPQAVDTAKGKSDNRQTAVCLTLPGAAPRRPVSKFHSSMRNGQAMRSRARSSGPSLAGSPRPAKFRLPGAHWRPPKRACGWHSSAKSLGLE